MVCYMTDLSVVNHASYADFLKAQGEKMYDLGSMPWMKYHGVLMPATAMPVYFDLNYDEALQVVKKSNAILLRYATGPQQSPGSWWNMVSRKYDFNSVSASTRSKIRRGLKRLKISQVNEGWFFEQAYDCHVECYKRYKFALPDNRNTFESFLLSLRDQPIFNVWGCKKNSKLLGYVICLVENNGVFMHTVDITPEGLQDYAAYAMIHTILEYYVNDKNLPVSNGSRSISHETEMQDFLQKFNFQREYSELRVVYRTDIKLIVCFLYPFRRLIKFFNVIPFVHKVSSILYQEEIIRGQASRSEIL